MGAQIPALSVIESASDLGALARHLRQFHLVGVPEQQRLLLRWYDTRILHPWFALLTPSQKSGFLHTIGRWQYHDRYGEPRALQWDRQSPPVLPPFQLQAEQYQQLLQACQTDGVLAQLRRVIPEEIRRVPYRTLFPFLEQHVIHARGHGIDGVDDLVQYALLALYTSGHFVEHSAAKNLPPFGPDRPFTEWAMALPEAIWDLGTPLWTSHTQTLAQSLEISNA